LALVTLVKEQILCQARSIFQKSVQGLDMTWPFFSYTEQNDPHERFNGAAQVLECSTLSPFNGQTIASGSPINCLLSTA